MRILLLILLLAVIFMSDYRQKVNLPGDGYEKNILSYDILNYPGGY